MTKQAGGSLEALAKAAAIPALLVSIGALLLAYLAYTNAKDREVARMGVAVSQEYRWQTGRRIANCASARLRLDIDNLGIERRFSVTGLVLLTNRGDIDLTRPPLPPGASQSTLRGPRLPVALEPGEAATFNVELQPILSWREVIFGGIPGWDGRITAVRVESNLAPAVERPVQTPKRPDLPPC